MDETTLVQQAKDGDVAAFRQLVRSHEAVAFRVALLIVGSVAEAEDATGDGLVKAYYALARFRGDAPFRPWLLRIVANEARNRRRSSFRRDRLTRRVQTAGRSMRETAASPEDAVIASLEHEALFAAISRLHERDREVIVLRYLAELSEAETAASLGCALGTAKSRLHRALSRLRMAMAADRAEPEDIKKAADLKAQDLKAEDRKAEASDV